MLEDLKVKLVTVGLSECPGDCLIKNSIHPTKAEYNCYQNCLRREEKLRNVILDNFRPFDERNA